MKKVEWKVLGHNILVKPIPQKSKTNGGIVIPDTAKTYEPEGEIIVVGPGRPEKGEPMQAKVGNYVKFLPGGFRIITIDDEHYLMMHEDNITIFKDSSDD